MTRSFSRRELTAKLAALDVALGATTCSIYDWDAWPLIRLRLASQLADGDALSEVDRGSGLEACLRRRVHEEGWSDAWPWVRTALAWPQQGATRGSLLLRPENSTGDAVLLTHANRTVYLGDRYFHYMADPLSSELAASGTALATWELGLCPVPEQTPHVHCSRRLAAGAAHRMMRHEVARVDAPPRWFWTVEDLVERHLGLRLRWWELARYCRNVQAHSLEFMGWLLRGRYGALLLDVWYDEVCMGATLAASRVGLPVVDYQHGLQGSTHPAYSGWWHPRGQLHDLRPSEFWVWSHREAEALLKPGGIAYENSTVQIVGNLWMNAWHVGGNDVLEAAVLQARRLRGTAKVCVLVTLQSQTDIPDACELLADAPSDWQWLVRVHRRDAADAERIHALIQGHAAHVDVLVASRLPLYALFQAVDCHVTWFSTCAVEALGFGLPSVILGRSGLDALSDYIADGDMTWASSSAEACRTIKRTVQVHDAQRILGSDASAGQAPPVHGAIRRVLVKRRKA